MSYWNLASADGKLSINLDADDDNGAIKSPSSVVFNGVAYNVEGGWIASGGNQGSPYSAFSFCGDGNPMGSHPTFLSASGIMYGSGSAPTSIQISVHLSSSQDGSIRSFESITLTPNVAFPCPAGVYNVTIDGIAQAATVTLAKLADGSLNPSAQWAHPPTGPALPITVTWDGTKLQWRGPHHHYSSATQTNCEFSGTYVDNQSGPSGRPFTPGTWTAKQGISRP
jgi:hypothetical protein